MEKMLLVSFIISKERCYVMIRQITPYLLELSWEVRLTPLKCQ